jgi:hypothetical protein
VRLPKLRVALIAAAVAACGGDEAVPTDAADAPPPPIDASIDASGPPTMLSQTGLYSDIGAGTIAPGVAEYMPRWQLWSDEAAKRRWIFLPPGSQIDTSDMDHWQFPMGTKIWKEFVRDGQKIETRYLEKTGPGATFDDWYAVSFQWMGGDAVAVPGGVVDDPGHNDIPSRSGCRQCHDAQRIPSVAVSFSALLLDVPSADPQVMNLGRLVADGRLTAPPTNPVAGTYFPLPADPVAQAGIGYLHVNCGNCHNDRSAGSVLVGVPGRIELRLAVSELAAGAWSATAPYRTTVGRPSGLNNTLTLVAPGSAATSHLFERLTATTGIRMPPIGREVVDPTGSEEVRAWIAALP